MCATSSPTHRSITSGSGQRPSNRSPQASRRRPPAHTPQQPLRLRHRPPFRIALVLSLVVVDAAVAEAICPRPTTRPTTSRTRTYVGDAIATDDIRTAATGIANARLTATATRHPSRVTSCFATYQNHRRPRSVRTRQSVTATRSLSSPPPRPPRRPARPCPSRSIGGTTWTSPRRWST